MMIILNDLHLGVKRSSGTTLESQAALKDYLYLSFETFIQNNVDDLTINGDLFDGFTVDPSDVLRTYMLLFTWLRQHGRRLVLVSGNHDFNPRADKLSSFHMLANLLVHVFEDQVQVVDTRHGLTQIAPRVWAIPSMPNQDLFDMELDKTEKVDAEYLLLHCNVASSFAEHSDHSLNISWERMQRMVPALIFGHEHQGRKIGKHTVVGNQWPSSISDCLVHGDAQRDGLKWALHLSEDLKISGINTWDALGSYIEVDWRSADTAPDVDFIRVTGNATAEEAADVVSAIATLRSRTKAFVVGNAVKVSGVEGMDELAEVSFDQIKSFDVLNALLELLDPKEQEVVKGLANA
jgi:3',5'-cyclic AMP phosphodiesterase CpdA